MGRKKVVDNGGRGSGAAATTGYEDMGLAQLAALLDSSNAGPVRDGAYRQIRQVLEGDPRAIAGAGVSDVVAAACALVSTNKQPWLGKGLKLVCSLLAVDSAGLYVAAAERGAIANLLRDVVTTSLEPGVAPAAAVALTMPGLRAAVDNPLSHAFASELAVFRSILRALLASAPATHTHRHACIAGVMKLLKDPGCRNRLRQTVLLWLPWALQQLAAGVGVVDAPSNGGPATPQRVETTPAVVPETPLPPASPSSSSSSSLATKARSLRDGLRHVLIAILPHMPWSLSPSSTSEVTQMAIAVAAKHRAAADAVMRAAAKRGQDAGEMELALLVWSIQTRLDGRLTDPACPHAGEVNALLGGMTALLSAPQWTTHALRAWRHLAHRWARAPARRAKHATLLAMPVSPKNKTLWGSRARPPAAAGPSPDAATRRSVCTATHTWLYLLASAVAGRRVPYAAGHDDGVGAPRTHSALSDAPTSGGAPPDEFLQAVIDGLCDTLFPMDAPAKAKVRHLSPSDILRVAVQARELLLATGSTASPQPAGDTPTRKVVRVETPSRRSPEKGGDRHRSATKRPHRRDSGAGRSDTTGEDAPHTASSTTDGHAAITAVAAREYPHVPRPLGRVAAALSLPAAAVPRLPMHGSDGTVATTTYDADFCALSVEPGPEENGVGRRSTKAGSDAGGVEDEVDEGGSYITPAAPDALGTWHDVVPLLMFAEALVARVRGPTAPGAEETVKAGGERGPSAPAPASECYPEGLVIAWALACQCVADAADVVKRLREGAGGRGIGEADAHDPSPAPASGDTDSGLLAHHHMEMAAGIEERIERVTLDIAEFFAGIPSAVRTLPWDWAALLIDAAEPVHALVCGRLTGTAGRSVGKLLVTNAMQELSAPGAAPGGPPPAGAACLLGTVPGSYRVRLTDAWRAAWGGTAADAPAGGAGEEEFARLESRGGGGHGTATAAAAGVAVLRVVLHAVLGATPRGTGKLTTLLYAMAQVVAGLPSATGGSGSGSGSFAPRAGGSRDRSASGVVDDGGASVVAPEHPEPMAGGHLPSDRDPATPPAALDHVHSSIAAWDVIVDALRALFVEARLLPRRGGGGVRGRPPPSGSGVSAATPSDAGMALLSMVGKRRHFEPLLEFGVAVPIVLLEALAGADDATPPAAAGRTDTLLASTAAHIAARAVACVGVLDAVHAGVRRWQPGSPVASGDDIASHSRLNALYFAAIAPRAAVLQAIAGGHIPAIGVGAYTYELLLHAPPPPASLIPELEPIVGQKREGGRRWVGELVRHARRSAAAGIAHALTTALKRFTLDAVVAAPAAGPGDALGGSGPARGGTSGGVGDALGPPSLLDLPTRTLTDGVDGGHGDVAFDLNLDAPDHAAAATGIPAVDAALNPAATAPDTPAHRFARSVARYHTTIDAILRAVKAALLGDGIGPWGVAATAGGAMQQAAPVYLAAGVLTEALRWCRIAGETSGGEEEEGEEEGGPRRACGDVAHSLAALLTDVCTAMTPKLAALVKAWAREATAAGVGGRDDLPAPVQLPPVAESSALDTQQSDGMHAHPAAAASVARTRVHIPPPDGFLVPVWDVFLKSAGTHGAGFNARWGALLPDTAATRRGDDADVVLDTGLRLQVLLNLTAPLLCGMLKARTLSVASRAVRLWEATFGVLPDACARGLQYTHELYDRIHAAAVLSGSVRLPGVALAAPLAAAAAAGRAVQHHAEAPSPPEADPPNRTPTAVAALALSLGLQPHDLVSQPQSCRPTPPAPTTTGGFRTPTVQAHLAATTRGDGRTAPKGTETEAAAVVASRPAEPPTRIPQHRVLGRQRSDVSSSSWASPSASASAGDAATSVPAEGDESAPVAPTPETKPAAAGRKKPRDIDEGVDDAVEPPAKRAKVSTGTADPAAATSKADPTAPGGDASMAPAAEGGADGERGHAGPPIHDDDAMGRDTLCLDSANAPPVDPSGAGAAETGHSERRSASEGLGVPDSMLCGDSGEGLVRGLVDDARGGAHGDAGLSGGVPDTDPSVAPCPSTSEPAAGADSVLCADSGGGVVNASPSASPPPSGVPDSAASRPTCPPHPRPRSPQTVPDSVLCADSGGGVAAGASTPSAPVDGVPDTCADRPSSSSEAAGVLDETLCVVGSVAARVASPFSEAEPTKGSGASDAARDADGDAHETIAACRAGHDPWLAEYDACNGGVRSGSGSRITQSAPVAVAATPPPPEPENGASESAGAATSSAGEVPPAQSATACAARGSRATSVGAASLQSVKVGTPHPDRESLDAVRSVAGCSTLPLPDARSQGSVGSAAVGLAAGTRSSLGGGGVAPPGATLVCVAEQLTHPPGTPPSAAQRTPPPPRGDSGGVLATPVGSNAGNTGDATPADGRHGSTAASDDPARTTPAPPLHEDAHDVPLPVPPPSAPPPHAAPAGPAAGPTPDDSMEAPSCAQHHDAHASNGSVSDVHDDSDAGGGTPPHAGDDCAMQSSGGSFDEMLTARRRRARGKRTYGEAVGAVVSPSKRRRTAGATAANPHDDGVAPLRDGSLGQSVPFQTVDADAGMSSCGEAEGGPAGLPTQRAAPEPTHTRPPTPRGKNAPQRGADAAAEADEARTPAALLRQRKRVNDAAAVVAATTCVRAPPPQPPPVDERVTSGGCPAGGSGGEEHEEVPPPSPAATVPPAAADTREVNDSVLRDADGEASSMGGAGAGAAVDPPPLQAVHAPPAAAMLAANGGTAWAAGDAWVIDSFTRGLQQLIEGGMGREAPSFAQRAALYAQLCGVGAAVLLGSGTPVAPLQPTLRVGPPPLDATSPCALLPARGAPAPTKSSYNTPVD